MNRRMCFLLVALFLSAFACGAEPVLVGRGHELRDVLLPGSELRVRKSRGLADPVVLRIVASYPHGTAGFRYDFHVIPMAAGKHNLVDYLETVDGTPTKGLPPQLIEATGVLPEGRPGMLPDSPQAEPPKIGGYEALIPYGIALWVVLGIAAVWIFRKRKAAPGQAPEASLTLAQKLRPLLERALIVPLGVPEKAELERLLLAHGRERLGLQQASDPAIWQALRENAETASFLHILEGWLHRPATSPPTPEELRGLLARIN